MNMPGFTAEASLYKTAEYYQCAAEWMNKSNDKAIIPQIPWWVLTAYCRPVFFGIGPDGKPRYVWWCGELP